MIRKISLSIIILVILFWFAGAHLVKWRMVRFIENNNSDNVKFSYHEVEVFPFSLAFWIKFTKPKLTIVGQNKVQELAGEELVVNYNPLSASAKVNLAKKINYTSSQLNHEDKYYFIFESDILLDIRFQNSTIFSATKPGLLEDIVSIEAITPYAKGFLAERKVVNLEPFKFFFSRNDKEQNELYTINFYSGALLYLNEAKPHHAKISLDLSYLVNEHPLSEEENFQRKISVKNLNFKFDNASIRAVGDLQLSRTSLPVGKFDINIVQYHDIVDILIPKDFILSQSYIKKLIGDSNAQELNKEGIGNAELKLVFSNQGITLGKINLLEITTE